MTSKQYVCPKCGLASFETHPNWKSLLGVVLMLALLFAYRWYLEKTDFPVVPEIITQAEFQELLDGMELLHAQDGMLSRPKMKELVKVHSDFGQKTSAWDDDGDGLPDYAIRLESTPKGALEEGHFLADSRVARVDLLDVLFGGEKFGIVDETMWVESDEGLLIITVFRPGKQDHSEFRPIIEEMLAQVRSAR